MKVNYSVWISLFAEGAASAAPNYLLVIKSLGLLNVLLLTAAVVMGIYCKHECWQFSWRKMCESSGLVVTSAEKTPRLWILLIFHILTPSGIKDNYLQVPQSAIAPLLAEMNFYRNYSYITNARLEVEKTAAKEHADSAHFRLEVKKQKMLTDNILKRIGALQTKKRTLQSDTNSLGMMLSNCQLN